MAQVEICFRDTFENNLVHLVKALFSMTKISLGDPVATRVKLNLEDSGCRTYTYLLQGYSVTTK